MGMFCGLFLRVKTRMDAFDKTFLYVIVTVIVISAVFLICNMQALLGKYYSSVYGILWLERAVAITISIAYAILGMEIRPLSVCFGYSIVNNFIGVIHELGT